MAEVHSSLCVAEVKANTSSAGNARMPSEESCHVFTFDLVDSPQMS